ncbi:hypothetical protein BDY17DRAFT_292926 [Neohortaea acidophila]|uniref:Uncharacterized protein n=1 Tax=Neohortaea acidophila TaxID=245834 RepID=A0A6A6PZA9_9PEZI|nr:uncharacterized protein BDY17DRAFT_292926 [Neohortaea acidophila]KAF2485099.1 hypothetical protein BDY17DRAFT_292926 [Neohortaea acidophila]
MAPRPASVNASPLLTDILPVLDSSAPESSILMLPPPEVLPPSHTTSQIPHDVLKRAPATTSKATKIATTNKPTFVGGAGAASPDAFNNNAILALFALLGAAMVIVAIWFFFWAKNGGFHFREGDWEDYKSTVLRRKGPDGRTLSNATKSTKLGGSTIAGTQQFKWAKQQAKSVVSYDEKGRKGILGKRGWGKTHSVTYADDFTDYGGGGRGRGPKTISDEMSELNVQSPSPPRRPAGYRDRDVQQYKKEKVARVGGLNRVHDGSHVDTTDYSDSDATPARKRERREPHSSNDKDRAERRARAEAAKMERRWKQEAEEAAAAIAREQHISAPTPPRKSAAPSKPSPAANRQRREASRSASPKKRDFSYQADPRPESEVFSSTYTVTNTSNRNSSYYDAYRPRASENVRYSAGGEYAAARQSSPTKKGPTRGYRRGGDSDLD